MVTKTGKTLHVIIDTETGLDWETFATWYSLFKNAPEAKVSIACARNQETPFQYYQWTKKLNIQTIKYTKFDEVDAVSSKLDMIKKSLNQKICSFPLMIINPLTMITDMFSEFDLNEMNNKDLIMEKDLWYLKECNIEEMMNCHLLDNSYKIQENTICFEAKYEENAKSIVSYKKGCGRWINKSKGCPFSSAGGLLSESMTVNESRIIEMWQKMNTLYSVVV